MDNVNALKQEIDQYIHASLEAGELLVGQLSLGTDNSSAYKKFRKSILDGGNDLLRWYNQESSAVVVRTRISKAELRELVEKKRNG